MLIWHENSYRKLTPRQQAGTAVNGTCPIAEDRNQRHFCSPFTREMSVGQRVYELAKLRNKPSHPECS